MRTAPRTAGLGLVAPAPSFAVRSVTHDQESSNTSDSNRRPSSATTTEQPAVPFGDAAFQRSPPHPAPAFTARGHEHQAIPRTAFRIRWWGPGRSGFRSGVRPSGIAPRRCADDGGDTPMGAVRRSRRVGPTAVTRGPDRTIFVPIAPGASLPCHPHYDTPCVSPSRGAISWTTPPPSESRERPRGA